MKSKEDAAVGGNEEGEGKCANSIYYSRYLQLLDN